MSSFRLHSEDSEFNTRVDALFSSLATAAVDLEPTEGGGGGSKRPHEEDTDVSPERRDGEFVRPNARPLNWRGRGRGRGRGPRNSTPDYVKNPQKWTRYSMKDTKVLNDRENKTEALRLFDKLRNRKAEGEDVAEPPVEIEQKIVFKKPVKSEDDTDAAKESDPTPDMSADALFGGPQKLKLAEYVVGKAKVKSKSRKTNEAKVSEKTSSSSELKLSHLMFEEEDE